MSSIDIMSTMALASITSIEDAIKMTRGDKGLYPLYAFFLYSDKDKDFANYIKIEGQWLHSLSGEDCLIGVFENPEDWGEGWERYWMEKLGPDYDKISAKWMELKPFDRDQAYTLASELGIKKYSFPCLVFVEDFSKNEILYMPIIVDQNDYREYFEYIFDAVNNAIKAPVGDRLRTLRSKWRKIWLKKILPIKIKIISKSINKWGSVIKETADSIGSILAPLAPALRLIPY